MKANTKYTALEILTEAGVRNPEEKFGKMRVLIGGITGIVNQDHLINVPDGIKKIDIIVGIEKFSVKINKGGKERIISNNAQEILDDQGKVDSKKANILYKEKNKK